jgi:hypothetical protein
MPSRVGRCRHCNGRSSCCSSPWGRRCGARTTDRAAGRRLGVTQQPGVASDGGTIRAGAFHRRQHVVVTSVAMLIAVVPAILSGVYLAEYTTTRTRGWLKPLIDLLVGIPSVVYGLWGILFIVPLIREQIGPLANGTLGRVFPCLAPEQPQRLRRAGGWICAGGDGLSADRRRHRGGAAQRAAADARDVAGVGRHALGDDEVHRAAHGAARHPGGGGARLFTRLWRDAGCDDGRRQCPTGAHFDLRRRLSAARADRQQLQRDDVGAALRRGADERRANLADRRDLLQRAGAPGHQPAGEAGRSYERKRDEEIGD